MVDDKSRKFEFKLVRQMPPWAPVELGGRGELKAPDLCRVQPMSPPRSFFSILYEMYQESGSDETFEEWMHKKFK